MPSCTGVVQAGRRRFTPETSTMHSRQAPTGLTLSRQQRVGMYLPLARATSRIVWPACAATYSPSILTEIFSGTRFSLVVFLNVAAQAAAGFVHGFVGPQADHGLLEALHAIERRQLLHRVPPAFVGLLLRAHVVFERGRDLVPAIHAHEPLIDV